MKSCKPCFDCHVHIGHFENFYYNPYRIIKVLSSCGISGAYVSSTTSCIKWNNETEKSLIVNHIINEFKETDFYSKNVHFKVRPLCWIIPQRYIEGESIESMFEDGSKYKGFKIHPRAHEWNLSNKEIQKLMYEICYYAEKKSIPIIIHTGICEFERPEKFEEWYNSFPTVNFVLAHCKDMNSVISLFKKYNNVYGDSAFCSIDLFKKAYQEGFSKRIFFGTDFPITSYMTGEKTKNVKTLCQDYNNLLNQWKDCIPYMGCIDSF